MAGFGGFWRGTVGDDGERQQILFTRRPPARPQARDGHGPQWVRPKLKHYVLAIWLGHALKEGHVHQNQIMSVAQLAYTAPAGLCTFRAGWRTTPGAV